MIRLYKNEKKNNETKEIIADLRKTQTPLSFKYYLLNEKIDWVMICNVWCGMRAMI